MIFKKGTGVRSADGKNVGKLDRVVVDPRTKEVNYIVVNQGAFGASTSGKVVPLTLVARADDDAIVLREDAGDLEQLPPFEERYYVPADEAGAPAGATQAAAGGAAAAPSFYPYPPLVGGEMAGLGAVYTPGSVGAPDLHQPMVEQTERSIPGDNVAVRPGEHVLSADGQHVGSVEQVLTGQYADRVTHFVIAQGTLFKDRKLIPVGWVSDIGEEEVRLAVDASFLGKLPSYNPPAA